MTWPARSSSSSRRMLLALCVLLCAVGPALAVTGSPVARAPTSGAQGPQGLAGPAGAGQVAVGTQLADPVASNINYGYVPTSHSGAFTLGVRVIATLPGLVSQGATIGWVASAGNLNAWLWDEAGGDAGTGAIVASALDAGGAGDGGICGGLSYCGLPVSWSTPAALGVGKSYVIAFQDTAAATYVEGGGSGERLPQDLATHVGVFYPSGVGRRLYAMDGGAAMPNLDDGTATSASITVVGISQVTNISSGDTGVDLYSPIEWSRVGGASAYYLRVGSSAGTNGVYDSGQINAVSGARLRRHIPGLATSTTYYATVSTMLGGVWFAAPSVQFTTSSTDTGYSFSSNPARAFALVAETREMADINNNMSGGTVLDDVTRQAGQTSATCYQYVTVFLELALEDRLKGVSSLPIGLINNGTDVHEIATVYDPAQGNTIVLDPTFGLVPIIASSGAYATPGQVQSALAGGTLSTISYQFLTPFGRSIATGYYLDWPILFDNQPSTQGNSPLPYLGASLGTSLTVPSSATTWAPSGGRYYIVTGGTTGSCSVSIDGVPTSLTIDGNGFSAVFFASPGPLVNTSCGGVFRQPLRTVF